MFGIIHKIIVLSVIVCALTACGPEEADAKKLGFSSLQEMKTLQAQGFQTKEAQVQSLGFAGMTDYQAATALGIKTGAEYQAYLQEQQQMMQMQAKKEAQESFLNGIVTMSKQARGGKGYELVDVMCLALPYADSMPDKVRCQLVLPSKKVIVVTLFLPEKNALGKYYKGDQLLFSGHVQDINYVIPSKGFDFWPTLKSDPQLDVDVSSLKNLSEK